MSEAASDATSLGQLVREGRRATGLTQRELAKAAGVSVGLIRALEQGLTGRPRLASIQRLSSVLGISTHQLSAPPRPLPDPAPRTQSGPRQVPPAAGRATGLELRVLGPLAAWRNGQQLPLGPARQRAVLGLLAVSPEAVTSREAISDALWGSEPPSTATSMIQSYVSRLRRVLEPRGSDRGPAGLLTATSNGYRFRAEGTPLDVAEFGRLTQQARDALEAGDPEQACQLRERALALWRGDPLADIDLLRQHPAVTGLSRRRAAAVVELAEIAVANGWPDRVLPHLQALAEREPLNERACAWLMIALAGCGQQAAALAAYGDLRHRLDEQLGVHPGPELAAAHERVLRHNIPVTGLARDQAWTVLGDATPGSQLPPAIADFTGREEEVAAVADATAPDRQGVSVPVVVISGLPGVGKTALALQTSHTVRGSFPDGQLWIPLDGSSSRPRGPGEVLGELLRTLGVPGSALPETTAARAALYRSRLAGHRVLVVADDAASAAQVEPLLPGTAGSAMIITSRSPLVAPAGARLLPLGPFTPDEAADLLGRIAGQARVTAEPQAATELAGACGLLPLAVRIAGARLAARPAWPIAVLTRKVTDQLRRLDELQAGDLSVRASLASSYEALDARSKRAFRLLGLLGPVEVAEWVVAALLAEPDGTDVVNELTDKSLLTPVGADAASQPRYRLHDLLRDYATERLADECSPDQEAALDRVLGGWLQLAALAGDRLPREPYFPPPGDLPPAGPVPAALAAGLTSDATSWFTAERLNLLAAAEAACAVGRYRLAADLARAQAGFCYLHSRYENLVRVWSAVATAADRAGDQIAATRARLRAAAAACGCGRHAEALPVVDRCVDELAERDDLTGLTTALYWRAVCALNVGAFEDACQAARRAMAIAAPRGDQRGELMALRMLGLAESSMPGPPGHGVANCERALALAREVGDPACEREVLHTVAHVYNAARRPDAAIALCQRGFELDQLLAHPEGQAAWLGVLGDAYHGLGRYQEAADTLLRARALFERNFMRRHQALCLLKLGYAHQAMANYEQAAGYLEESLPIFRELQLPHYEERARQTLTLCQNRQFVDLSTPPAAVASAARPGG